MECWPAVAELSIRFAFSLIGVRVWKLARKNGYTTQIEFFRDRLDSDLIGLLLFPCLVGLIIPYLLIGVLGSGSVVQALTAGLAPDTFPVLFEDGTPNRAVHGGVPPWLGSLVICVVVLIYVFFGGMRGTTWANTLQTMVFMVLGVVTFYVIATKLGGQNDFMSNLRALGESIPEDKATRAHMSQVKFFTYILIPLSVGMFPHIFQHWMTAKSASSFKLPVVFHPIFILIVWLPCVLVGTWATGSLIPEDMTLPGNPNTILPFLVTKLTGATLGGKVLAGLLAAGILAAIMSSLDSQFLCIGTIFANDILTHYRGKANVSDKQQILSTRLFIIAIVALTYFLSLGNVSSVFAMGVWCFSGFTALLPIVIGALYWRGLSAAGAICGVLAAIGCWGYLFNLAAQQNALRTFALKLPLGEEGISLMPVVAMITCSSVAMVVVSLITPKPSKETLAKFFDN